MDRATLSTLLGFSSIAAWLCAQIPQLFENWKNSSVEGLALPFLVSWLFGDLTNLIGYVFCPASVFVRERQGKERRMLT